MILHRAILYNYVTYSKEMHTFQINALIQVLASSTYLEPHGFIMRKTICTSSFCMVCASCIYVISPAGGRVYSKHGEDVKKLN